MDFSRKRIGVLSVQGAFAEHIHLLEKLGARAFEIRKLQDIQASFDGLILPGGESSVQARLVRDLGLFEPLKRHIQEGMPTLATCAGLILLARTIEGAGDLKQLDSRSLAHLADARLHVRGFQTLDVCVMRNAYGRQLGSFCAQALPAALAAPSSSSPQSVPASQPAPASRAASARSEVPATLAPARPLHLSFIRAPKIVSQGSGVQTLVELDGVSVCVQERNQIAMAFHPEVDEECYFHERLLMMS